MMLAPASNAAFASRAISSGVTGTWCCFGSVSTPFSAQVMTALSLMDFFSIYFGDAKRSRRDHACVIIRLLASMRYRAIRIARSREPEKIARGFRP